MRARHPRPLNLPIYTHCQDCGHKLPAPVARGFYQPWALCGKCRRKPEKDEYDRRK